MQKILILILVVALATSFVLPRFAIVTRDVMVFDEYGLILYQGTIVRLLECNPLYCYVSWDIHEAWVPRDALYILQ